MLINMKGFSYCLLINSSKMLVNKTETGQGDRENKSRTCIRLANYFCRLSGFVHGN